MTVEKLEDRRSIFEMICAAQRVTMRSEEVRQYIEQGGYITWEWLEKFGCRELSREEIWAETAKAGVIVKAKRRLRKVLWAWRRALERPARFRTLSPAEEERRRREQSTRAAPVIPTHEWVPESKIGRTMGLFVAAGAGSRCLSNRAGR